MLNREDRRKPTDEVASAFREVFRKYFPHNEIEDCNGAKIQMSDPDLVADLALAKAVKSYIDEDRGGCGYKAVPHFMQWFLASYIGLVMRDMQPKFEKLYQFLSENGHTKNNRFDWNDIDNFDYILPSQKNRRAMVMIAQNWKVLVIFIDNKIESELHIRELADRMPGKYNIYGKPLTLKHYINNGYQLKYGDNRDEGYVISHKYRGTLNLDMEISEFLHVDLMYDKLWLLNSVLFDVDCLEGIINSEDKKELL